MDWSICAARLPVQVTSIFIRSAGDLGIKMVLASNALKDGFPAFGLIKKQELISRDKNPDFFRTQNGKKTHTRKILSGVLEIPTMQVSARETCFLTRSGLPKHYRSLRQTVKWFISIF